MAVPLSSWYPKFMACENAARMALGTRLRLHDSFRGLKLILFHDWINLIT